ncbi:MAG: hypothetical protein SGILL_004727, partial [Bacillariaceae sp.]
EIEQYVLVASDATNPQHQQQANALLHQWVSSTSDTVISDTICEMIKSTNREVVLFYALTLAMRLDDNNTNSTQQQQQQQRAAFRQELFRQLLSTSTASSSDSTTAATNPPPPSSSQWAPAYLRTKVGVLMAHFIHIDFPLAWPSAFDDLMSPQLLQAAPDIFLRTLVALMDEFGKNETDGNAKIKDYVRGYSNLQLPTQIMVSSPDQSISGTLIQTVVGLLEQSLNGIDATGQVPDKELQTVTLSLTVLKGFMSWVDLMLVLEEKVLQLIFSSLAKGSSTDSPLADAGTAAIECLEELIARGMEDDKKIYLLQQTRVFEHIHSHVDLKTVDASPIDVVMETSKFINRTGLEVFPIIQQRSQQQQQQQQQQLSSTDQTFLTQLLELFFLCFAYDDIDVSGAVIPLAGSLVSISDMHISETLLPRLLSVTFAQMKYPADFQYDFEDDDEAEEEMYRTELRKLNQKFVRANPELCLQFLSQALAQLPLPLSSAPTSDVEASINLMYQYCEGIRPPPGMKVVMKNDIFRNLLIGLHSSDIEQHPHREVVTLYYETSVRYYPILKEKPELLQKVMQSMTGPRGLQHEHLKVRSRCCYLLLRLIKSVGSNNTNGIGSVLRPYVESAISGIQSFLETYASQIRSDDTLNLFETIGLLLGKTGLSSQEQQQYLTQVITPHVHSIECVLVENKQAIKDDPDMFGENLSNSIAAIAYLSKGFKRPSTEVQVVLLQTVPVAMSVLEAVPGNEQIRSKTLVLTQRLIQCLEAQVLPFMPRLLFLLISHCTTDDILDVSQLMNQLCIKYKSDAVSAVDADLLPFLQKCQYLSDSIVSESAEPAAGIGMVAPHLLTEKLSIQKLSYSFLQHVLLYRATAVLLSPTNVSSLEAILKTMSDGAINVADPIMKKSCLVFFRELLDQWIVEPSGTYREASTVVPPDNIVQGLVGYFCEVLVPGMLQVFFASDNSFNADDANSFRCIAEFCAMLEIIKNRLPDVYYQRVLTSKLSVCASANQTILEGFRTASARKDFESCFKALIQQNRQTQ